MVIKRIIRSVFFFLLICLSSCDENRVYDSYKPLNNSVWKLNEPVRFQFSISDTIDKHNLFFGIRNNQNYQYSNLFLISELNFPNGKKVVDTLEYRMADPSGRFLGTGLSSNKENKLFYRENIIFPVKGSYQISIYQAMRKIRESEGIDNLQGITDVGFRIEKVK